MDEHTVKRLNQINREFYRITAENFDATRGRPWPGWDRLLPHLRTPLTVLDVGCGNGRFGLFLHDHYPTTLTYHGLDSNPALLEKARTALSEVEVRLSLCDVIEQPPDIGTYNVVALFGVLHHVPGRDQRRDFVQKLAERVAPGGLLVFSAWRFYEYERFRERIVPWPDDFQVEPGDYLLDWRRGAAALRYCHYVDDAEHAALIAASGLRNVETYRADGFTGDVNCYSLLKRDTS